nr:helix-turn-helix transcriptional regulator [Bacillus sp. ISL-41]
MYERRRQKGLTISELAKRTKISKSYLSNIERDLNRNPSIDVVQRIAAVLDIELEEFLRIEKTNGNPNNIDEDLISFAAELKESGIQKEQISEYKTLFEFIQWKNQNPT